MNTKTQNKRLGRILGALAIGILSAASLAAATGERQSAANEDPLSAPVRRAIAQRMVGHGSQMNLVVQAGLMLDYSLVEANAKSIAEAQQLGRPAPGERNTLAAAIPTRFFDLQDQLKSRAMALVAAAHRHDAPKLGQELGQLLSTCVACHSTYLFAQAAAEKNYGTRARPSSSPQTRQTGPEQRGILLARFCHRGIR